MLAAAGTYTKPRAIPRVSGTRISYSGRYSEMFYTYGLVKGQELLVYVPEILYKNSLA
jgi:hypothetical protein